MHGVLSNVHVSQMVGGGGGGSTRTQVQSVASNVVRVAFRLTIASLY